MTCARQVEVLRATSYDGTQWLAVRQLRILSALLAVDGSLWVLSVAWARLTRLCHETALDIWLGETSALSFAEGVSQPAA